MDTPQRREREEISPLIASPLSTSPLSERMPDYIVTFTIGLVASLTIGLVVWYFGDSSLSSSLGYTVILYGTVLLLAGGASGGGYTSLGMGALGTFFGTRRIDDVYETGPLPGAPSPKERLRRGLRPDANPRAFWQVIGGAIYVAVGLSIVINWS